MQHIYWHYIERENQRENVNTYNLCFSLREGNILQLPLLPHLLLLHCQERKRFSIFIKGAQKFEGRKNQAKDNLENFKKNS